MGSQYRTLVIGGGFSGLLVSHFLQKRLGHLVSVTLVEKRNRCGGRFSTARVSSKSVEGRDYLFEEGHHWFHNVDPYIVKLAETLGLYTRMISVPGNQMDIEKDFDPNESIDLFHVPPMLLKPKPQCRQTEFPRHPHRLLNDIYDYRKRESTRETLNHYIQRRREEFVKKNGEDECIWDFGERRFNGRRKYAENYHWRAAVDYFGDSRDLSIRSSYPHEWFLEHVYGSLHEGDQHAHPNFMERVRNHFPINTPWMNSRFNSFEGGMGQFAEELFYSVKLQNADIRLESQVNSLDFSDPKSVKAVINGEEEEFQHVFSTIPSYELADIMANSTKNSEPISEELVKDINSVEHASVYRVHFGWPKPVLQENWYGPITVKEDIGYIMESEKCEFNPDRPPSEVICVTNDSHCLPANNYVADDETRLTLSMGGAFRPDVVQKHERKVVQIAKTFVKEELGVDESPDVFHVNLEDRVYPQFRTGYYQTLEDIEEQFLEISENFSFVGHSFHGLDLGLNYEKAEDVAFGVGEYVDPNIDEWELKQMIKAERSQIGNVATFGFQKDKIL